MDYLEELVLNGAYEDVKKYMSGFAKLTDEIFLEISVAKYVEARDRNDDVAACEILQTEIVPFKDTFKDFYEKVERSFLLDRKGWKLGDLKLARGKIFAEMKNYIEASPLFAEKLVFPQLKPSGLRAIILKQVGTGVIEINQSSQCCSFKLPDSFTAARVMRLVYNNSGNALFALTSDSVHKLWKWNKSEKASASISPEMWHPVNNMPMTNETSAYCIAIPNDDSYAISASGGKIVLLSMKTFQPMTTSLAPPEEATMLAFNPQNINVIAIGMENSTIHIYHLITCEHMRTLVGHKKMITGLAFSKKLNLLVSSGADSLICAWDLDDWKLEKYGKLQLTGAAVPSETAVQFHQDQMHLLVVHPTQIGIYQGKTFECLKQWVPGNITITHATYSCDSKSIYASLKDGTVNIFTSSNLSLRCRITPTAYLNVEPSLQVYPVVVAAHPTEPNQFALGLTDGGVQVVEPREFEGKWGDHGTC